MVQLVGVLNVTPDSFSDGGWFFRPMAAVHHAQQLFEDGAGVVDVGAESTRPNAEPLSVEKEWLRLEPVLRPLLQKYPGKISLDSYHPETVRRALQLGPVIVNDVTGLHNPEMVQVVLELKPRVIISHLPGHDIQQAHQEPSITSVEQVRDDLLAQAASLEQGGLPHENIILDPGIGFGKTMEVNRQLLEFARLVPNYPVMIGYSRKRFLGEHRMELAPNLEAGKTAVQAGAVYLRVHDVVGHRPLLSEPRL
jgi:dihydropteroate synthase